MISAPSTTGPAGLGTAAGPRPRGNTAQTLDRGLRILQVLAGAAEGLKVAELAARLGLHRAVVHRLLATLADHRLVARTREGHYRLGTGLVDLAQRVSPGLQAAALPELSRLAEEVGATAFLTVADGDEAVALAAVEPRRTRMHVAYRPGSRHPLDVAASGIAILAGRPPRPGERAAVTEARARGYAVSRGELQPGTVGIAAPVVVGGRPAEASVAVVALGEAQLDEAATAPRVVAAAAAIAAALG